MDPATPQASEMVRLRKSRAGAGLGGAFLSTAIAIRAWLLVSAYTDAADSGEGGVLLFAFTLPWTLLVPESILGAAWFDAVGPWLAWGAIALNAFLLYCVAGGLRAAGTRNSEPPPGRGRAAA
jgi:hypothetical protein